MKARHALAGTLGAAAAVLLVLGVLRLLDRFEPGCTGTCTAYSAYYGAFLTVGGLLLGALATLLWTMGRPA